MLMVESTGESRRTGQMALAFGGTLLAHSEIEDVYWQADLWL